MSLKKDVAKAVSGAVGGNYRDLSVLASAYAQSGMGAQAAAPSEAMLPRDPKQFVGNFGPSMPATLAPLDDLGQQGYVLPRVWQEPVGFNLPTAPGATKLVDFRTLRQLADTYDVLRSCIRVRSSEIAKMKWEILTKDPKESGYEKEISELTKFWEKPDRIAGYWFDDWIKVLLEEVFVNDALSLFPHETWLPRRGVLGSSLASLEVIDGTTIKPLVDLRGARPQPPNPAYQQYLYGVPRTDLASSTLPAAPGELSDASDSLRFSAAQLYYRIYHPRVWTPYGFSNVEQIILNVNLALRRQQWHTAYFTDGTIPAGLLHVPEEWNPTQIREYEEGWNALLGGSMAWKHRVRAVPGATGFSQLKPPVHDMTFDEWVARITCAGMDVTPAEVNFEPKGGLGGAGWSEQQENILYRKSLEPLVKWLERLFNNVMWDWFGVEHLQFKFLYQEVEDAYKKAQANQININTGVKTIDEVRGESGLDPYENDMGSKPLLITRMGPVLLEDVDAMSKGSAGKNPDGTPKLPSGAVDAQGNPVQPLAPAESPGVSIKPINASDPEQDPNNANRVNDVAKAAALDDDEEDEKSRLAKAAAADLRKWEVKATRRFRTTGSAVVPFTSDSIPDDLASSIKISLPGVRSASEVRQVFSDTALREFALARIQDALDGELLVRT